MYLIDTSAWIESFNKGSKFRINDHFQVNEVFICLPIYQEILQGIKDDSSYAMMKRALDFSRILDNPIDKEIFEEAISIYRQARKKGITIRSSMDCLISAIAIKHDATVIHLDRDFLAISTFTTLKESSVRKF